MKNFNYENRTSINVSKKFRDLMQIVASMYYKEYNQHITISNVIESLINRDDKIFCIYEACIKLGDSNE
mgnify:CR=1 FL=1